MTRPSFRFFIIPLGAICTLASLSAQNTAPRAQRDQGSKLGARAGGRLQQQEPCRGLRDPLTSFYATRFSGRPSLPPS